MRFLSNGRLLVLGPCCRGHFLSSAGLRCTCEVAGTMPSGGSRSQDSCSSEFDKEELSSPSVLFHLPEYSDWLCWDRISPLTPHSVWRDGAVIGQPGHGRGYNLPFLAPTALHISSAEVSVRKHVWQRQYTSTAHPEVKAWRGALTHTRAPGSHPLHSGRQGWRGPLCSPPPGSQSLHSEESSALFLILCSSYFSWSPCRLWVWVRSVLNNGPYRRRLRAPHLPHARGPCLWAMILEGLPQAGLLPMHFYFFLIISTFNYCLFIFWAVLGLRFCTRGKRWPLFITMRGPLTIAASLVAEHRLQMRRLSSCGSRA